MIGQFKDCKRLISNLALYRRRVLTRLVWLVGVQVFPVSGSVGIVPVQPWRPFPSLLVALAHLQRRTAKSHFKICAQSAKRLLRIKTVESHHGVDVGVFRRSRIRWPGFDLSRTITGHFGSAESLPGFPVSVPVRSITIQPFAPVFKRPIAVAGFEHIRAAKSNFHIDTMIIACLLLVVALVALWCQVMHQIFGVLPHCRLVRCRTGGSWSNFGLGWVGTGGAVSVSLQQFELVLVRNPNSLVFLVPFVVVPTGPLRLLAGTLASLELRTAKSNLIVFDQ